MDALYSPILLTLGLAASVTLVLLALGTPLAWWLSQSHSRVKEAVAAIVQLPLVLPPTVLGFYLLIALGPSGPGGWLAGLWGARTLAFSFTGLVIGSVIYSLPFMVQPLRNGFDAMGREPIEAATTLGASGWQRFWRVAVPAARPGYITGAVLTFAHTVGEFGVVLMIGGNIPGETRVVSVAIYNAVERLDWGTAHLLALGLVVFAFFTITLISLAARRGAERVTRD